MDKNFLDLEKQYFDLLLRFCLKIDKSLFVSCDRVCEDALGRFLDYAKEIGVKNIHVFWQDAKKEAEILKNISFDEIKNNEFFDYSEWNQYAKDGAAFLIFKTDIPEVFNGIEEKKMVEASKIKRITQSEYKVRQLSYEISWTIAILPNEKWAKTLYDGDDATARFYNSIFEMCMISHEGNAMTKWQNQLKNNSALASRLNSLQISELNYKAPNGTNLSVKIAPSAVWLGADKGGFVVNMPTYEVFTFPDAFGINGVVKSTRPLHYNGTIIDDFELHFKDGKVIKHDAKKGKDALGYLLSIDKGSRSLGEVAIVDCRSPVALQNKVFGITLFDENASCHFALGNAYPGTCKEYSANNTPMGFNVSAVHVDFMVGYDQLTITAKTNGGDVTIMDKGRIIL